MHSSTERPTRRPSRNSGAEPEARALLRVKRGFPDHARPRDASDGASRVQTNTRESPLAPVPASGMLNGVTRAAAVSTWAGGRGDLPGRAKSR